MCVCVCTKLKHLVVESKTSGYVQYVNCLR